MDKECYEARKVDEEKCKGWGCRKVRGEVERVQRSSECTSKGVGDLKQRERGGGGLHRDMSQRDILHKWRHRRPMAKKHSCTL